MEEQVQVKEVEAKEEVSTQEKEAAVLEKAVESGEVDSNYGFQEDGVYRVNVDAPPKKEENASEEQSTNEVSVRNEPEASEEVSEQDKQEGVEELTEQSEEKEEEKQEEALEIVEEPIEEPQQENVQETKEEPVQTNEYPEDIQKLIQFMEETNGTLEDYVNLNRDYSKMNNTSLVYEYYKNTKPHLDNEDLNFLMQKEFAYDEEVAEPSEIKAKQLAFKEELYKAQKHFNDSKEKYYADLKLRKQNEVPEEYKEAYDFYNEATKIQERAEKLKNTFDTRTNSFFSDDFKGFDFKVGEKKYRFKVDNKENIKNAQSTIDNFIKPYLNKEGEMEKVGEYHKALFTARNADKLASHFYEQGRADAIKESVKKSKNIDMSPRPEGTAPQNPNNKVRVVESDSSNRLRIKWNK
tara:strand:- start:2719 stop:3945 length:1227 start_codon:yes stop_codon:yes gene_type:complete